MYQPSEFFIKLKKNIDLLKLEAFADDKSNMAQMMGSVTDRIENIVEKGENAVTSIFSFSPQCILKEFSIRIVET